MSQSNLVNPWALSVEKELERLRRGYAETFCPHFGVKEPSPSELQHLARMAPPWPDGPFAFRGFRKRFDSGDKGVALTFEANDAHIKKVFGWNYYREPELRSGKYDYPPAQRPIDRLRLLVGNHTHHPVLEWVCYQIKANQQRASIAQVHGRKSLADELFDFVWLFPEYIYEIWLDTRPSPIAAGYEVNIPENDDGWWWMSVPSVSRLPEPDRSEVHLGTLWLDNDSSDWSVPELLM